MTEILTKNIPSFRGIYFFLSNFYPIEIEFEGITYPSIEYAYVASKLNVKIRHLVLKCKTPGEAKRLGRVYTRNEINRNDAVKTMLDLLRSKFKNEDLRKDLLATGDKEIIEYNNWGDKFWGVSDGEGENSLGKLIMKVRDELRVK